jgi:hypothetical protein
MDFEEEVNVTKGRIASKAQLQSKILGILAQKPKSKSKRQ